VIAQNYCFAYRPGVLFHREKRENCDNNDDDDDDDDVMMMTIMMMTIIIMTIPNDNQQYYCRLAPPFLSEMHHD